MATQYLNCPDCSGQGRIEKDCHVCGGSGEDRCWACNGYGLDTPGAPELGRCQVCRGTGGVRCGTCKGSGTIREKCNLCRGIGQMPATQVEQILKERQEAEQRQREESRRRAAEYEETCKRREAEQARKREEERVRREAEARAKREAEEREARRVAAWKAHVAKVTEERQRAKECVLCGSPLGMLDKLSGRKKHERCTQFTDRKYSPFRFDG